MKKILYSLCFFAFAALSLVACSKEFSAEGPGFGGTAAGSLLDSLGTCKQATIKGNYKELEPLTDSNYILISANFITLGKYTIQTDTVNGMWFRDTGFALIQGTRTIQLKGYGQPILPGTVTFQVKFGNSTCSFTITTTGGVNNGSSTSDYLSITAGGYIDYELSPAYPLPNGNFLQQMRATISAGLYPQSYNGVSSNYTRYTTDDTDSLYYRKNGTGKYFHYGTPEFEYFYLYDTIVNNQKIEFVYLDESKNPGQSFDTDSLRVGIFNTNTNAMEYGWAKLKIITLSKGNQMSLLGTLYTDIIKVRRELYYKPDTSNTFSLMSLVAELSYAKGIGLVDQRIFEATASGTTVQSLTIKGWNGL